MKKYRWKKACAAVLTAAALGNTAYAAETDHAADKTPIAEYSAEEMSAFQDHILEYWEIPGLIEHYNTSYLKQLETYYGNPDGSTGLSMDQLTSIAAKLRAEAAELKDELDEMDLKKSDDLYKDYMSNIKSMKRYATEMEDAAKGSASTRRALKIVKNQTTISVCGKMRNYQALAAQDAIQKKNLELAKLSYESACRQSELGIYAKENLLAAADSLNAAQKAADSSAASAAQAKRELIMELGWGYGDAPEIKPVPEPEISRISGYDLEKDTAEALNNNYDISDLRKTKNSELGGLAEKNRQIRETEASVRIQMEYLYKDVLQKQTSYGAALNGWTAAQGNKAQADRKYELGMISRQEYLAAEITWLTEKAAMEQAGMNLTAAMETYDWAVKGLVDLQ